MNRQVKNINVEVYIVVKYEQNNELVRNLLLYSMV